MNHLVEFFTNPYRSTPVYLIALEFIAMVFGIASVIFSKRENKLVFPTGFISTAIYIYILYKWGIFGDLTINVYYTIMSIYGWYVWSKVIDEDSRIPIPITRTTIREKWIATGIFISAILFVIFIYRNIPITVDGVECYLISKELNFYESIQFAYVKLTSNNVENIRLGIPYLDIFTTASAFVAMWLMTQKKIEHWIFWILTNVFAIPLYFIKGLGFTGIQYIIFLILAIQGFKEWRKSLSNRLQTA